MFLFTHVDKGIRKDYKKYTFSTVFLVYLQLSSVRLSLSLLIQITRQVTEISNSRRLHGFQIKNQFEVIDDSNGTSSRTSADNLLIIP